MPLQTSEYRDLYFSEAHQQLDRIAEALRQLERARDDREALETAFRATHTLKGMSATMGYDPITASAHALEDLLQSVRAHPEGAKVSDLFFLSRELDSLRHILAGVETNEPPPATEGDQVEAAPPGAEPMRPATEPSRVVRVTTEQLDRLNDLIIGLLASSQQLGNPQANRARVVADHLHLTQELRETAWYLRLAPIGESFDRYPQMLYNLAREQGKEIRVRFEGAEVEVERSMLESINEPLLHLLRNAVVHGIESVKQRIKAGKDPCGTVRVSAYLEEETLVLTVADDGHGLDAQLILDAAYVQGFISKAERYTLREAEAFKLITRPGFSLSRAITPAAGRGIGLDVVRAKVEALHGNLTIDSAPGQGAAFILRVPRTLGPIQVELVRVANQVYALPAARIEARLTVDRADWERGRGGEPSRLGRTLRLLDLHDLLSAPRGTPEPEQYGVVVLKRPAGVALGADALLGKALWSRPAAGQEPPVPLLDLDQLLPDEPGSTLSAE